jgi:hypothetical protein
MLHGVALVTTDVSEERSTSIIKVTRICELGMLAVTSNQRTLRENTMYTAQQRISSQHALVANIVPSSSILVTLNMEALRSSKTSLVTRVTWRNIPEDSILLSQNCENLKSYVSFDTT